MVKLRVTRRCEAEDLAALPTDIADDLLKKFEETRTIAPESGERIQGLRERHCFSLHAGRYRAATWHDRGNDVVWLIAAGVHRADSPEDFYRIVQDLEAAGILYPSQSDDEQRRRVEEILRWEEEAAALRLLRDQALRSQDAMRQTYRSPYGLYVELWSEQVPNLALVHLRVRLFRSTGVPLQAQELAVIVRGPLTEKANETPNPEQDWRYRCFEEYIEV